MEQQSFVEKCTLHGTFAALSSPTSPSNLRPLRNLLKCRQKLLPINLNSFSSSKTWKSNTLNLKLCRKQAFSFNISSAKVVALTNSKVVPPEKTDDELHLLLIQGKVRKNVGLLILGLLPRKRCLLPASVSSYSS